MVARVSDDECCRYLIDAFAGVFPNLQLKGGAEEPFYVAPTSDMCAIIYFRSNFPRSLLHEVAHYCLAGDRRRTLDDFGFWYSPCGRTAEEQVRFEIVEARPQGLEMAMCEIVGLKFSPSLDDFSGRPPSADFLQNLDAAYREMLTNPPLTAAKALNGLKKYRDANGALIEFR